MHTPESLFLSSCGVVQACDSIVDWRERRGAGFVVVLASAGLAATLLGCAGVGDGPAETADSREDALWVDKAHLWPSTQTIFACWENDSLSGPWTDAIKKNYVRGQVRLAWTHLAGISGMYVAGARSLGGPSGLYMTASSSSAKSWQRLDARVTFGTNTFKLANAVSGLCLGVTGMDTGTPGSAELYPCAPSWDDGKQDEEWGTIATSNGYFWLVNANGGGCLRADGTTLGSRVTIDKCVGTGSEWTWQAGTNTSKVTLQLINRASNLCLGVPYNDHHGVGIGLEVWACPPAPGDPRNDENWFVY